jgi:uncharacterized protein (TIGR00255 family)
MAGDILSKLDRAEKDVNEIAKLATDYAQTLLKKTHSKIDDLLLHRTGEIDMARLEAEVAIIADKADINEEITRLLSHIKQMIQLANTDNGTPVGRRMEFLIQEMGREANTIGSKSSLSDITHKVVSFKSEIEKLKEMVQNIE